ncbi:MAG: hypothetical protein LPJ89_00075 [Hymenobacteraceae bacterium]|nr:hypothetical protein [Hymenobacteraceae bacterium]MDX5396423.1 hypothetical protein [Hymenobacteraceae bacterium]MDX5442161.1 hypothetical protein [Hymenobacteraceae bacterium]MDX5512484.1 hypothetical protein [Hymenobacteraceae bacterium]
MEAVALYKQFGESLSRISEALKLKVETRTMPYEVSLPLEARMLSDVLREKGINLNITADGYDAFFQLKELYEQQQAEIQEAMRQILEDKRAYMKTPEGKVLTKEMLIRRLEYFRETAHTLEVMLAQRELKSPRHHHYPYLQ